MLTTSDAIDCTCNEPQAHGGVHQSDRPLPMKLFNSSQSGFRPGHSTETAVLRVLSDILQAVDRGDSAALILLDLSAAFDMVDHSILLQRLQTTFGIHDATHWWFHSYLYGRYQYVRRGSLVEELCVLPELTVWSCLQSDWLPSVWRCLSYRGSAGGYLLIECRGVAALQMRSSQ